MDPELDQGAQSAKLSPVQAEGKPNAAGIDMMTSAKQYDQSTGGSAISSGK